MNAATSSGPAISVEIDDIQSGALHHRPSPYVGKYVFLRVDDRHAGRELLRWLLPAIDSGLPSADPNQDAWVAVALTCQGLRALGVPQDSLDSFPARVPAGHGGPRRSPRRRRRERPRQLGAAVRDAGRPHRHLRARPRRGAAGGGTGARPRGLARQARCGGDLAAGGQAAPHRAHHPRASRTASAIRASRGPASPAPTPRKPPSRPASSSSATPTRRATCRRCRSPRSSGATGPTRPSASCTRRWRPGASTCARTAPAPRRRRCWRRRWSGAGRAGRRWSSPRSRTIPELGADSRRNNDFLYRADDDRGFKCPAGAHIRRVNPRDADIIGVTPAAPHHPARHHLRAAAAGGCARGRRGRPRPGRGLHWRPPGPAVRVHQDRLGQRRQLHRVLGRKRPGGRPAATGRAIFTIPEQPVRRRLQNLPSFVVTRGGEYCFVPGLRALRWLADLDT